MIGKQLSATPASVEDEREETHLKWSDSKLAPLYWPGGSPSTDTLL